MERSSKMMKTKELRKLRPKTTRKSNQKRKQLVVQLHHFANLSKSNTTIRAPETKALIENNYFQVLNQAEFVAKPFVINSVEIPEIIRPKLRKNAPLFKKEFKDLVAKKFKGKEPRLKNPFAIACLEINSMVNIKDYKRVYTKKILENRLFINGVLVYDKLKQHYSGLDVSRNCLKKKFVTKLNKVSKEVPEIPEMDIPHHLFQDAMDFYENQENNINLFNQIPDAVPAQEMIEARPSTPENMEFGPESYQTPPSQRLIPVDLSATSVSKYERVYIEKYPQQKLTSLFELPENDDGCLKRIDFLTDDLPCSSGYSPKNCIEKARKLNDLEVFEKRKCAKKRLFMNNVDVEMCDDEVFVRPTFSPREFNQYKRKAVMCSPVPEKCLKVDELDSFKNVAKLQSPKQYPYHPFVQFNRSK